MKLKKALCMVLAFFTLVLSFTACEDKSEDLSSNQTINESGVKNPSNNNEINNNTKPSGNNGALATVYSQYSNLVSIGPFHNGLAYFLIKNSTYDYRYGYIDIQGNVVIEPTYRSSGNFEYDYVKVKSSTYPNPYLIIDRQGNIIFETEKNNVSAIGEVSNGYFWVETVEELITGNVYTVKYYSVKDLSVVATFYNHRADDSTRIDGTSKSSINNIGEASLYDYSRTYYGEDKAINIADYDSSFVPTPDNWSVDIRKLDVFSSVNDLDYKISSADNDLGQLATIAAKNQNGVAFFAVLDSTGNFFCQPQQSISFYDQLISNAEFRKNLCPAKDVESNLWGYIDPYGNWKIQPQYSSATPFSPDGYATVNKTTVIDTQGNTVLSPYAGSTEFTYGTYTCIDNGATWSLTFDENGELKVKNAYSTATSKYEIKGNVLTIHSDIFMFCPGIGYQAGEFIFKKEGNILTINGTEWTLSET